MSTEKSFIINRGNFVVTSNTLSHPTGSALLEMILGSGLLMAVLAANASFSFQMRVSQNSDRIRLEATRAAQSIVDTMVSTNESELKTSFLVTLTATGSKSWSRPNGNTPWTSPVLWLSVFDHTPQYQVQSLELTVKNKYGNPVSGNLTSPLNSYDVTVASTIRYWPINGGAAKEVTWQKVIPHSQ